ncbi:hypothetical protein UA08_05771 [Talaromyces atroroseus]|uniref:Complex III subunit 7 n=1 Tax=Talaromyces atroroseus TaxID=1441469 RepID=A0A225ACQ8_TALAT|nr:hypothetical protein UA08_05771 [Talaromyces atroroseus]OKL58931.1 hypothetical protein UA08_05771 [Talaromyces atroroseus]
MSVPSLTSYVVKRPYLKRWLQPVAEWYTNAAGYRRLGLRYNTHSINPDNVLGPGSWPLAGTLRLFGLIWKAIGVADDLIPEESELVQKAIKRLPPKEAYDRVFRLRRAFQCSISHTLLPAAEQTKPEEDQEYLSPIIRELQKEEQEREDLDNLIVKRK